MPTGPIVPDTSAFVEYLRATGSAVDARLGGLIASRERVVMIEPVLMEVLAGARTEQEWRDLRSFGFSMSFERVRSPGDWEDAALLHRRVRLGGHSVRSMIDCLVAAVAIRIGARVLHADADFDVIAQHSPLEIAAA